jgi:hypothetical protein
MYDRMHAEIHRRVGATVDGLLVHVGRATTDGFQTLEVWESKEHYDRANTDIVFPLMRELAGDQPPTGHGEFNPLWHVFLIVPSSFDEATETAYATHLPVRSEADVDKLLDTGLATEIDTRFYFLCSVVNGHAARP